MFRSSYRLLSSEYRIRQWSPSDSNPDAGESQSQLIKALEYLEKQDLEEIARAIGPHSAGKETLFHPGGVLKTCVSILKFGKFQKSPDVQFFLRNRKLSRIGSNFVMVTISWSWAVALPQDTCSTGHDSTLCSLWCKSYLMLPWHWCFSNRTISLYPFSIKSKRMNKRKRSPCIWRNTKERRIVLRR